jgi:hypothetical protein
MISGARKHVLVTIIIFSHYHHDVFLLYQPDGDLCDGDLRSHEAPAVCLAAPVSGGQEANAVGVVCGVSRVVWLICVWRMCRLFVEHQCCIESLVCTSGLLIQLWKQGDIRWLLQQSLGHQSRNIAIRVDVA